MKLLIAEDNPQMRQLIHSMVSDLVECVALCSDGEEAINTYASQQFGAEDCVLMDLHMPGMNGLEATRRIRSAYPEARIFIVTQYDDAYWRKAAAQAGACGYVLKENLLELRRLFHPSY